MTVEEIFNLPNKRLRSGKRQIPALRPRVESVTCRLCVAVAELNFSRTKCGIALRVNASAPSERFERQLTTSVYCVPDVAAGAEISSEVPFIALVSKRAHFAPKLLVTLRGLGIGVSIAINGYVNLRSGAAGA